jgi:hypothetical protein
MKIKQIRVLIDTYTGQIDPIIQNLKNGISTTGWPIGSSTFKLNPTKKGNGVKPIKNNCIAHLESLGWKAESKVPGSNLGPLDAVFTNSVKENFALEWETGNISSSHRAVNKLAKEMLDGRLQGGFLVLPSKDFYKYLTDRVGNFPELEPYFSVWSAHKSVLQNHYLAIIEIEHDELDEESPLIAKGTDGRALK